MKSARVAARADEKMGPLRDPVNILTGAHFYVYCFLDFAAAIRARNTGNRCTNSSAISGGIANIARLPPGAIIVRRIFSPNPSSFSAT